MSHRISTTIDHRIVTKKRKKKQATISRTSDAPQRRTPRPRTSTVTRPTYSTYVRTFPFLKNQKKKKLKQKIIIIIGGKRTSNWKVAPTHKHPVRHT